MVGKRVWKSVGVTEDVKELIKKIAKRENLKQYEVVELAVRRYATEQKYKRKNKEYHAGYTIDRELWYAFKLVNSIAQLKFVVEEVGDERKINEYRNMTMRTIAQIEERLGLDLDNVKNAVEKFVEKPNGRTKAELNDETKVAMARILFS